MWSGGARKRTWEERAGLGVAGAAPPPARARARGAAAGGAEPDAGLARREAEAGERLERLVLRCARQAPALSEPGDAHPRRADVVNWMQAAAAARGLMQSTWHLAARLFDLAWPSLAQLSLELLCAGCLLIALKYNEADATPALHELLRELLCAQAELEASDPSGGGGGGRRDDAAAAPVKPDDLVGVELRVLKSVGFFVGFITPCSVLDNLLALDVSLACDSCLALGLECRACAAMRAAREPGAGPCDGPAAAAQRHCRAMLNHALRLPELDAFRPHVVAAACIAAGRRAAGLPERVPSSLACACEAEAMRCLALLNRGKPERAGAHSPSSAWELLADEDTAEAAAAAAAACQNQHVDCVGGPARTAVPQAASDVAGLGATARDTGEAAAAAAQAHAQAVPAPPATVVVLAAFVASVAPAAPGPANPTTTAAHKHVTHGHDRERLGAGPEKVDTAHKSGCSAPPALRFVPVKQV